MSFSRYNLKNALKPFVPQFIKNLRWNRIATRHRALAEELCNVTDGLVQSGVFQGMKYMPKASGSMLGPKILGTYEREIHGWIENAIGKDYDTLIDIGAAEGFYAVGFLCRSPNLRTHSFDLNRDCHHLQSRLAELNRVQDRLKIHHGFEHEWFEKHLPALGKVLFFVDVDGAENELLDTDRYPLLRDVDLIVETHDCFVPAVTDRLIDRFKTTHDVERVSSRTRRLEDLPALAKFTVRQKLELANEHRPPQEWLSLSKRK